MALLAGNIGQFCRLDITPSTPTARFELIGSLALDTLNKLEWQRCFLGTIWSGEKCTGEAEALSIEDAQQYAVELDGGWRVPSIKELFTIKESSCIYPSLNLAVFPYGIALDEEVEMDSYTNIISETYWHAGAHTSLNFEGVRGTFINSGYVLLVRDSE